MVKSDTRQAWTGGGEARPSDTSASSGTMTAVLQKGFGPAASERWRVGEAPMPVIGADEVLVQVRAAGIDRGTWHLMTGVPYAARLAFGLRSPTGFIPGRDVAGVVVQVGRDVQRFEPGDEVYGTSAGSFAEYTAASERRLARKPANLTFEQAAAVPVSGLTALQGLVDVGRLEPGWQVLVNGASGGVGTWAVQIAATMGATVTATCSSAKADLVRSLGAAGVLDHADVDLTGEGARYDLVFDLGGNTPVRRLRKALTPRGTLVIGGGDIGRWIGVGRQLRAVALSPFVRQRLTMLVSRERYEDLERLTEMIEAGRIAPAVDRTYIFDEASEAMDHLAAGRARGKVVLVPRDLGEGGLGSAAERRGGG